MNGKEFIRKVRKIARKRGVRVSIRRNVGKGSHQGLVYGEKRTVVPIHPKDLPRSTIAKMCRQIGLPTKDIL